MTCRVARLLQDPPRIDLVFCSECGSSDLDVCHTSNTFGPHLCQTCAQTMAECRAWEEPRTRPPMWEQPVA